MFIGKINIAACAGHHHDGLLQNRCMGKQFVEKGNNNGLSSRERCYRKLHEKCTVLHDTFAKEYI
jgi:hypothetical protein